MRHRFPYYLLFLVATLLTAACWISQSNRPQPRWPGAVAPTPTSVAPIVPTVELQPIDPTIPCHWGKGQINGVDYYIVPLSA